MHGKKSPVLEGNESQSRLITAPHLRVVIVMFMFATVVSAFAFMSIGRISPGSSENEPDIAKERKNLQLLGVPETVCLPTANSSFVGLDFMFDYETNTTDSGCTDLKFGCGAMTGHADAWQVVPNNHSGGQYVLQTKMLPTPEYANECGNGYRSETSTVNLVWAKFFQGEEWEYTFSVLMKDWEDTSHDSATDSFFQLKQYSSTQIGAFQIVTVRNKFYVADRMPVVTVKTKLNEITPNIWYDFQVRVLFSNGTDGWLEVFQNENDTWVSKYRADGANYNDDNQPGYLKWGLYDTRTTPPWTQRLIYHDNLRLRRLA